MTAANWALATVMLDGPTACLEVDGNLYRLGPSLARAGWSGATDVASLFSDWDRSRMNVVAGQSGHPFSRHYKDQWNGYCSGTSYPMQFSRVDAKHLLRLEP